MWLTGRDVRLLQDLSLSHVLSRDQIVALGYFGSITRVNFCLRRLVAERLVVRMDTPFHHQSLYVVGKGAVDILGPRIGPMVSARLGTPRFLQHALMVTNTRIRLLARGATSWRFEQQCRVSFAVGRKRFEVRPDGLTVLGPNRVIAVEVDLGHVAPEKFRAKLEAYDQFVASGSCEEHWPAPTFRLLTLTQGARRVARLLALTPPQCHFEHIAQTFAEFNVPCIDAWS